MNGPGNGGRGDPFSGMDASVDEDDRFALVFEVGGGDLHILDGTTFEGVGGIHNGGNVRVLSANVVNVIVDLEIMFFFTNK